MLCAIAGKFSILNSEKNREMNLMMNCWKMKSGTGFKDRQEIKAFVKAFKENNPVTCAIFCHTLQYDSVEALVAMVRIHKNQ